MKILLVLAGFAIIAAADLPGMIRNGLRRDLICYSAVFLLVLILAVLMALGVGVPSPIKALQAFYRDVLHLSFTES